MPSHAVVAAAAALLGPVALAAAQPCFGKVVVDASGVTSSGAQDVAIADLNGDGAPDLVVAGGLSGRVVIYLGAAAESGFEEASPALALADARAVFAADMDGDTDLDIVAAGAGNDRIVWFENSGPPTYAFVATPHDIAAPGDVDAPGDVFVADLDGDGHPDVLSASSNDDRIAWFENPGGGATPFTKRDIDDQADRADTVFAADLDGDGDLDVLAASGGSGVVAWFQNDGAMMAPAFAPQPPITTMATGDPIAIAAHVDGDAHLDILVGRPAGGKLSWFRNDGGATPGFTVETTISTDVAPNGLFAIDLDLDGDTDVLSASMGSDTIAAHTNVGASGSVWSTTVLDDGAASATSVAAADLDGDGDVDVAATSSFDNTIAWHARSEAVNVDTGARFDRLGDAVADAAAGELIAADPGVFGDLCQPELDLAGKAIEILSLGSFVRPAGAPTTLADGAAIAAQPGASAAFQGPVSLPDASAATLGGDRVTLAGPVSVGAGATLTLGADAALAGRAGFAAAFPGTTLTPDSSAAFDAIVADIDGDNDLDIITASTGSGEIGGYLNDGSAGPSFTRFVVTDVPGGSDPYPAAGAESVDAADLDGDGDLDLVSAARIADAFAWHENVGALGFANHVLPGSAMGAMEVRVARIGSDPYPDILAAAFDDDTIAWFEHDGQPSSPTFTRRDIVIDAGGASSAFPADVNGDGLDDVITTAFFAGDVIAHLVADGAEIAFIPVVVDDGCSGVWAADAADLDRDGDTDLVAACGSAIRWYENDGNDPPAFTIHEIPSLETGLSDVHVVDIDLDGDLDILTAAEINDTIALYASDGSADPVFSRTVIDDAAGSAECAVAGDLDGDGDPDVVAAVRGESVFRWYENRIERRLEIDAAGAGIGSLGSLELINRRVGLGPTSTLGAASTISIDASSGLGGLGAAVALTIESGGAIVPDPAGVLTLDGDYSQSIDGGSGSAVAGTLVIDLGAGPDTAGVAVTGAATLAGALLVETDQALGPQAFDPPPVLLTAASLGGSKFDVALLPSVGPGDFLSVQYNDGARAGASVSLVVNPLTGDITLNPSEIADPGRTGVPTGATLADLDLDGDPDLLIALPDAANPTTAPGSVVVLYNDDDGNPTNGWEGFGAVTPTLQVTSGVGVDPSAVAVGLLDGDAQPDIAVANRGDDTVSLLLVTDPNSGSFSTVVGIAPVPVGDEPADVIISDLDQDGRNDIATANSGDHTITFAPNEGPGTGSQWERVDPVPIALPEDDECPLSIRPGDTDAMLTSRFVATANAGNSSIGLVQINPDRTLVVLANVPTDAEPRELVVADLDGDGRDDVATVNRAGNSVSIALNESAGSLAIGPSSDLPIDAATVLPSSITAGDYDTDGDTDLAVLADGVAKVLRNDLTPQQLAFTPIADQPAGIAPLLVRSDDLNVDGQPDLVTVAESAGGGGARSGGRATDQSINTLLASAPTPACAGDVNGDGATDVFDFSDLAAAFGSTPADANWDPDADLNGDGEVDVFDFSELAADFGCGF
jgi:hypothetical protein